MSIGRSAVEKRRVKQFLGIVFLGRTKDSLRIAVFDNLTVLQHQQLVAERTDDTQVVAYENIA